MSGRVKITGELFGNKVYYESQKSSLIVDFENGPMIELRLSPADKFKLASLLCSDMTRSRFDNLIQARRNSGGAS